MKYEAMIREIITKIGGRENIISAYHCATRLRFKLKEESKADEAGIKEIEGVLSVIKSGGQFQVVIGQHVGDVYKEMTAMYSLDGENTELKDAKEFKEEMKDKKVSSRLLDTISGVFTPVLGMLMAIGASLVYPSIAVIMAGEPLFTAFSGTIFESPVYVTFLGIPVILMNYASSVIPVIIICYFAAKVEKFLAKRIGDLLRSFLVPALTLIISVILGLLIIGPVVSFISSLLGAGMSALFNLNATIAGFLYGALIQVCVMFGVHWGFVAISINNLATLGFDPITIAGLASAFGQAGVVLVILLKTRNKKLKSICGPALISSMFGITEPCVYGVTLQYKKSFLLACIASGFGGAIIGAAGVKQYIYGVNGVFGWLQTINPAVGFDSTTAAAIMACVVSFVAAIVLMLIFGKNVIQETNK
ncbi:PTS transporter subunit EIIC [Faecalicatena orotica]|uniref:PTS transporter subunit EIIC n=1 Tax=Faecalicatena orotica TaxID=1544 RepID=UPI0032173288